MFCDKCGNIINEGDNFCNNCGKQIIQKTNNFVDFNNTTNEIFQTNNNEQNNNKTSSENDNLGLVSLIIGIVAIIFILTGRFYGFILGIIGLVLGIVSKKKDKNKKIGIIGIILNIVSLVIGIIIVILIIILLITNSKLLVNKIYDESASNDYIEGTWNCSKTDKTGKISDYIITMKLNEDNIFIYGEYGDLKNNYAGGTYTYEKVEKITYL